MSWNVGEAKQQFSEVLRRSQDEPQLVYSRKRLVAVIVSPDRFAEFERWRQARQRSLAQSFEEIREICAEDGWALEVPAREDRPSWISDDES
jgi:prevent-host-death family protein